MQGFPRAHCRVLAVEIDWKDGFVLVDTGPAEYRYLYGGTVEQLAGGWCGGIDSNGGGVGWTVTNDAREVGVVSVLWRSTSCRRCGARGVAQREAGVARPKRRVFGDMVARAVAGR